MKSVRRKSAVAGASRAARASGAATAHARPVDHLVLPVESLEVAAARMKALGFTVAPVAVHPFGTENACVFLADGTYLEPLAIAQRETCEEAARKGNVFVARDQAYRFRRGNNGFSGVAFASVDAKADHAAFRKAGMSAGNLLNFSRFFADKAGNRATASFRIAFVGDLRAPDAFFFTCQRLNAPAVDRSKLQRHKNGAIALHEVFASEANPSDFQYWLQTVTGSRDVNAHSFGIEIATPNANVAVYNDAGMQGWFAAKDTVHGRGLRLQGAVFAVRNLAKTGDLLKANGIGFRRVGQRLVVPPAPGQGAIFAFEART